MPTSSRRTVREAVMAVFDQEGESEPPQRLIITPSATLFRRVAVLAEKLNQSWNQTALLLLNASVDEALDVADTELKLKMAPGARGLSPEQVEGLQDLSAEGEAQVMDAFAQWADHRQESGDDTPFTHPLLRGAQLRDEQVRQALEERVEA